MLCSSKHLIQQYRTEISCKRGYSDEFFGLIVGVGQQGKIVSFQLCYDKDSRKHALTWKRPSLYGHQRVDDGENRPGKHKSTPVLLPDGAFDPRTVAERFKVESSKINQAHSEFVCRKLLEFDCGTVT